MVIHGGCALDPQVCGGHIPLLVERSAGILDLRQFVSGTIPGILTIFSVKDVIRILIYLPDCADVLSPQPKKTCSGAEIQSSER